MLASHTQKASEVTSHQPALGKTFYLKKNKLNAKQATLTSKLLTQQSLIHHPKAGLNPLVDAAGYLFSLLGQFHLMPTYRQLGRLHKRMLRALAQFQEKIAAHYSRECVLAAAHVLSAMLDDAIYHTTWGKEAWQAYSLLNTQHATPQPDRFFTILEYALQDPTQYIDLMELMYLAINMGYRGAYRQRDQGEVELQQISNQLYQHIRAQRGNFSKTLTAHASKIKPLATHSASKSFSFFILLATACVVMVMFISLGYLMDVISHDTDQTLATINQPFSHASSET